MASVAAGRRPGVRPGVVAVLEAGAAAGIGLAGLQQLAKRSGRRQASLRSKQAQPGLGPKPLLWCTWVCSRATSRASSRQSVGTFQRSATLAASFSLRLSWPMWRPFVAARRAPAEVMAQRGKAHSSG